MPDGNVARALEVIEDDLCSVMGNDNPDIVLLGDFNIDVSKQNAASRKLSLFTTNNSLKQIITTSTRVTNTT